jgi:acetyl esterase/lipase
MMALVMSRIADLGELAAVVAAAEARMLVRRITRGPLRPGWSLGTEAAVTAMRAPMDRSKRRGVAWLKRVTAQLPERSPLLARVRFEQIALDGVRGLACTALGDASPARTIVYLHGGGYVIGSPEWAKDTLARFALGAGARVVAPDYRLAPEHRFPAGQDDCLAFTRAVLRDTDPRRVAIAGDSAGGALAVATLCSLRDAGEALPAAGVLFCPWTDPLAEGGSMLENEPFDFGDRELLVGWARLYAGDQCGDPRMTVLAADLAGLPPLLVQAGGAEILLDQIVAFAARAEKAGVETTLQVAPDMFHDWQVQAALVPAGVPAMEDAARFVREHLA